jgi:hypothetical protein
VSEKADGVDHELIFGKQVIPAVLGRIVTSSSRLSGLSALEVSRTLPLFSVNLLGWLVAGRRGVSKPDISFTI